MSVSETATGVTRGYSPAQKGLEDLLGDRRRDGTAEAVQLLLENDRDGVERVVGRSEGDEPRRVDVRDARLGRPGLAGDRDARDLRLGAGAALDDELHHLIQ